MSQYPQWYSDRKKPAAQSAVFAVGKSRESDKTTTIYDEKLSSFMQQFLFHLTVHRYSQVYHNLQQVSIFFIDFLILQM